MLINSTLSLRRLLQIDGVVISWVQSPLSRFTTDPMLSGFLFVSGMMEIHSSSPSYRTHKRIQIYWKEKSFPIKSRSETSSCSCLGWFTVQLIQHGVFLGDEHIVFPSLLWASGFGLTPTCSAIDLADCFLSCSYYWFTAGLLGCSVVSSVALGRESLLCPLGSQNTIEQSKKWRGIKLFPFLQTGVTGKVSW